MPSYSLSHLSDRDLLRGLASLVADDRTTTAMLLAHIAEVDARRLYVPAGFPSMFLYCVHELHLSEPSSSPGPVDQHAPGRVESERPKVTTLARQRFALQVTLEQTTHDKLRYLQALLSHQVPSGELARVLDRTFDAAIRELERGKFAATDKPRPGHGRSRSRGRYIPAEVRRTVWKRDGGQCTFVSATGQRCPARTLLQFDHIDPVALR